MLISRVRGADWLAAVATDHAAAPILLARTVALTRPWVPTYSPVLIANCPGSAKTRAPKFTSCQIKGGDFNGQIYEKNIF